MTTGRPCPGKALTTADDTRCAAFESIFLGTVRLVRDLSPHVADGGAIALVLATSARKAASTIPISSGLRPGLALLVKNFADELGPRNIRVNTLLPNLFGTDRINHVLDGREPPVANLALKRIGDPVESGRMAAIVLPSAASYVTGAAISVDGGQLKVLWRQAFPNSGDSTQHNRQALMSRSAEPGARAGFRSKVTGHGRPLLGHPLARR